MKNTKDPKDAKQRSSRAATPGGTAGTGGGTPPPQTPPPTASFKDDFLNGKVLKNGATGTQELQDEITGKLLGTDVDATSSALYDGTALDPYERANAQ